jgi:Winged helix-turn helix
MRKRYPVMLSEEERARLHTMIGRGVAPASVLTHARILLKANQGEAGPGWTDAAIGVALEVNPATVARVRTRYVAAGLDAAISRKPPARQYHRRLDGEQEARLVALTCSAPPQGPPALDVAAAGRPAGGAGGGGVGVVRDGPAGLAATQLKPWLTEALVHPTRARRRAAAGGWRTCLGSPPGPTTRCARRSGWTRPAASCSGRSPHPYRRRPGGRPGKTTSTCGRACATCSWSASRWLAGATSLVASGAPASTGRTPVKELVEVHDPDAEQIVLVQDNPEHPHAGVAV